MFSFSHYFFHFFIFTIVLHFLQYFSFPFYLSSLFFNFSFIYLFIFGFSVYTFVQFSTICFYNPTWSSYSNQTHPLLSNIGTLTEGQFVLQLKSYSNSVNIPNFRRYNEVIQKEPTRIDLPKDILRTFRKIKNSQNYDVYSKKIQYTSQIIYLSIYLINIKITIKNVVYW